MLHTNSHSVIVQSRVSVDSKELSIEGFRGINNEGAPLVLKFRPDQINSISAPNGVGKTSIFDSVV